MKRVYYMFNGRKIYVSAGSALVYPEQTARRVVRIRAKIGCYCFIEDAEGE